MQSLKQPSARLLTPCGRGAVATIVLEGDSVRLTAVDRLFTAANGRAIGSQRLRRLAFGRWGTDEPFEDLVICRIAEREIEIHCHGGKTCVQRILSDLRSLGFETADEPPSLAADLSAAVCHARTLRTAGLLLKQQRAWSEFVDSIASMESCDEIAEAAREALKWAEFGRHLTEPWQIAIVGPPNVGKSTLLNALLGFERAIVFDQPGTTRDVVSARTVFGGWPVQISDTAGIRDTDDPIESTGVRAAQVRGESADLRLEVTDLSDAASAPVRFAGRTLYVGNKVDKAFGSGAGVDISVSATAGQGIEDLIERICQVLVPDIPPAGQCVPVTETQRLRLAALLEACGVGDLRAVTALVRDLPS